MHAVVQNNTVRYGFNNNYNELLYFVWKSTLSVLNNLSLRLKDLINIVLYSSISLFFR